MSESPPEQPHDHWLDHAAALIALPIAEAHRPGVIHYLNIATRMAELVFGLALDPKAQPAPVFRPASPVAEPGAGPDAPGIDASGGSDA